MLQQKLIGDALQRCQDDYERWKRICNNDAENHWVFFALAIATGLVLAPQMANKGLEVVQVVSRFV